LNRTQEIELSVTGFEPYTTQWWPECNIQQNCIISVTSTVKRAFGCAAKHSGSRHVFMKMKSNKFKPCFSC